MFYFCNTMLILIHLTVLWLFIIYVTFSMNIYLLYYLNVFIYNPCETHGWGFISSPHMSERYYYSYIRTIPKGLFLFFIFILYIYSIRFYIQLVVLYIYIGILLLLLLFIYLYLYYMLDINPLRGYRGGDILNTIFIFCHTS
jgi:hypothetical protein